MKKRLPCRASPGDPTAGIHSSPLCSSSWRWRNVPIPSAPLHPLLQPPEPGPGPTSREEGVRILDEGFHHANHLDGGHRGQVQLHRVSERQGWGRHQKKVFGALTLLVSIPEGAEPKGRQPSRGGW